jgi:hypothetical protein
VEHLTHIDAACNKIDARSRNVGDDQVEALGRAWRRGCDLRAELNRARRVGRRELNDAEAVIKREVGVEPPPECGVELLRAVNIRDRDDDLCSAKITYADNSTSRGRALKMILVMQSAQNWRRRHAVTARKLMSARFRWWHTR